ncbi:MAG: phosphotransferase [Anaerolineae bacterium]|nr:phosphotransferase [Anaerolineae bacterium]
MLTKPHFPDAIILADIEQHYGVVASNAMFLPIGADANAAVYRIGATTGDYFAKLKFSEFDKTGIVLPKWLAEHGFEQVIAPIATRKGALWAECAHFTLLLYPFVSSRNAYDVVLSPQHWHDFGVTLKQLHRFTVPPSLAQSIRREAYSPRWRMLVAHFLQWVARATFADPIAADLAAVLLRHHRQIMHMLSRAADLAQQLQANPLEYVLCHADAHAGNVLLGEGGEHDGKLYVVDWDAPMFAPKERDLMFVGGGLGFAGHTPSSEETLFYRGYGIADINFAALSYYRYERIIEDIALYCQQVFESEDDDRDRAQAVRYVASNFTRDSTIERAYAADRARG